MKINRNNWQTAFEKELDKAERRQLSKVKRFYKSEYNKGVVSFLAEGQTNFQLLFDNKELLNIYRDLYSDIGLQFAKWYAKNYDKYLSKGINPSEYVGEWTNKFASFGSAVGAQRVTLVSGTAKQTLIKVTQNLMRDPEFMTLGNTEKGRILKSQFNRYSQYQSERLVRTEATNAANFATMESATTIFPGAQMKKEWIASFDDRTRSTHSEAGASEPIPYNNAFMVGGSLMMYPGDPSGPASEVVNCRCSVAPFPVKGAQAVSEITDINFGIGGAASTGFGLTDVVSAISSTLVGAGENTAFIPAKTLQEAEERMLKFANSVNFEGLTLKKQNEILNALEDVLGKYKSKVKNDIGFQTERSGSWGVAGYRLENGVPSNPQYLRLQKTYSKSADKLSKKNAEIFLRNKEYRLKQWEEILSRPDLNAERSAYYRDKIQKLKSTKRWTIEGERSLYTTTAHESFHIVDYTYGARNVFSEQLIKNNIVRNEWYQVSEYGGSTIGELWAEVGAAIQTKTNIPNGFIKAFEDTLKIIGAI